MDAEKYTNAENDKQKAKKRNPHYDERSQAFADVIEVLERMVKECTRRKETREGFGIHLAIKAVQDMDLVHDFCTPDEAA